MSVQKVRCPCLGNPACKLCGGSGVYDYEVGPRGLMPFTCPTCEGTGKMARDGEEVTCVTCGGSARVDPGFPPPEPGAVGLFRKIWKIFMGG